jgi:hypothetical protein
MKAFGAWLLWMRLRYCGCEDCYGHRILWEKWGQIHVCPSPIPRFDFWETRAGWRILIGWFDFYLFRHSFQARSTFFMR